MTAAEWSFDVPATLSGQRIDSAVALLTGYSRSEVQTLIADGHVLVNGTPVAKSERLEEGAVVDVTSAPPEVQLPRPEPMALDVRYADDDVIVIAKPAGLVVHPGAGRPDKTLVNGLLNEFPEIANVGEPMRPGIVHRLDRDTSGLMMVARSQPAYEALVTALSNRTVHRQYIALVWGKLESTRGMVDAPVGRSARQFDKMSVRADGKEARTRFERLQTSDDPAVSLVRCELETGRTHQIRVHFAAVGHPVVGDIAYGSFRESLPINRPFLHAEHLAFAHPITGEHMEFTDPLPAELQTVLDGIFPT